MPAAKKYLNKQWMLCYLMRTMKKLVLLLSVVAVSFALQAGDGACSKDKAACDKSKAAACEKVKVGTCTRPRPKQRVAVPPPRRPRKQRRSRLRARRRRRSQQSFRSRRSLLQSRGGDFCCREGWGAREMAPWHCVRGLEWSRGRRRSRGRRSGRRLRSRAAGRPSAGCPPARQPRALRGILGSDV